MTVSDARFEAFFVVRLAEATGMSQLKADHQVIGAAESLLVSAHEDFAQFGQIALVLFANNELSWIGPSVGANRHGLAAIDQLGTAFSEALPAPAHFLCCSAGGRAVPSLHGLDRPAIADALAIDQHVGHGLAKRR